MDPQNTQWNQNSSVDAYLNNQQLHNAYQAQNAALNFNRQEFTGILSANAPEFIPKTIPPQLHMNDWHQQSQQQQQQQVDSRQVYSFQSGSRGHFVNPQQRHPVHQQQIHHQQNHIQHHQQQQQHQFRNQPQPPHMQGYMMMNNHVQRPDFMPGGGGGGNGPRGSIQNRLQLHHNPPPPENDGVHAQTETEQIALDYLTEVVNKLNDNPGMFENHQKKIREMFLELSNNHFVLSNAIEIIFEQSINEQNFRYTGARLCLIFDNLDSSPSSTFRSLLSMKMEYQQAELVKFMQNEQRRVRGTTLFLAELFVQLRSPDEGSRNTTDISRYVLNSILLLLSKPGPENVKCVCQTLKLSGYELQLENPTDVEEAITQLKFISEEQNVQTKRLIQSVVDLFYDNWGRKDLDVAETQTPIMPENIQQNFNDGPVFYGPDGEIITEEENSFLISNINPYPININEIIDDEAYDLDDDEDDEPEMDLEMRMAFEEFSKNQK